MTSTFKRALGPVESKQLHNIKYPPLYFTVDMRLFSASLHQSFNAKPTAGVGGQIPLFLSHITIAPVPVQFSKLQKFTFVDHAK